MPIRKTFYKFNGGFFTNDVDRVEVEFVGRVVALKTYTATRNHSDTLDYTDFRTVECTDALVYVGPVGSTYEYRKVLPETTFQWVKVKPNLFVDRGQPVCEAEVDCVPTDPSCDPEVAVAYDAWVEVQEHLATELREARRRDAEARAAHEEKLRLAATKREAKRSAAVAAATTVLTTAPAKGASVTTEDGKTGVVFWRGVTTYRGRTAARLGVKTARGETLWTDADKVRLDP